MIERQKLCDPIGGFKPEAERARASQRPAATARPGPLRRVPLLMATLVMSGRLAGCGGGAVFIGDGVNATLNVPPARGNGTEVLSVVVQEPAGRNCARGGSRVDSGIDANRNQVLEASEVQTTRFVCNA